MDKTLLGGLVLAGCIGMYWLIANTKLGFTIFFTFLIGWSAYFLLSFTMLFGVDENIPLIGGVVIGIGIFIFGWIKRDKPLDKITEQYLQSGTGGNKDGIDDGDG